MNENSTERGSEGMHFWKKNAVYRKKQKPLRETDEKSASLPASSLAAGMTVEAALVLPIFLFFMMEILYLFEAVRLQSGMLAALHETGTQMGEYAFYAQYGRDGEALLPDEILPESLVSFAVSETAIRKGVADYLGEEYLEHSCLQNGKNGISCLSSSLSEDGTIDLVADYRIRPFLPMFGLGSIRLQSRYYGHAWTGYEIGSDVEEKAQETPEEEYVYITPEGTVYHKSRSCTYLKPKIRTIPASSVDEARSRDGSRYYPCERCHPSKSGTLIITAEGNRYHSSASCSAIQRDVQEITLSEAQKTRRACSKCGG